VGRVPTYIVPHSEVHTLPRFLPGVRRVDVRGTWRPEIMAALRLYGQAGLLSTDPIRLGGVSVAPKEVLRSLYLDRGTRGYEGEYAFFLHVEVAGRRGASEVVATYDLSHPALPAPSPPPWGPWTTGSITGIPASIGAQRLARGEVSRTGVLAPEAAFDPGAFFADLGRRGIRVAEEVVVRTRLAA
jgi:saccharopine dehydrogenase (NAD+, L-lysine-forming)